MAETGSSHAADPEDLEDVLHRLLVETDGQEQVTVGDVLAIFEERLLGPALCVPALVVVTPLGGIPGLPTVTGVFLVLLAGQRLVGRTQPWIPRRLRERSVDREKLRSTFDRLHPWARRLDGVLAPRLAALVTGPMSYVNAALVVLMGALMPPLEIVPFATAAPGLAVLLLGLAVTARDGALALAAWLVAGAALWFALTTVL